MMTVFAHMKEEWQHPGYQLAIWSGLALGIGFQVPQLWFFGTVGIVLCIRLATHGGVLRQILIGGGMAWFIKYLVALAWYISIYPIDITALPLALQIAGIGIYWGTSALWLSVGGVVFVYVTRRLYEARNIPPFVWYIVIPFIWLGSESFGAFVFSIMTAGPGSLLQSYFSFGMVGYLLAETTVGILLAGVSGVYGLSICYATLAVGLLAAQKLTIQRQCFIYAGVLGFFLFGGQLLFAEKYSPQGITVIGIDTNFSDASVKSVGGMNDRASVLSTTITAAVKLHPHYIMLPEESRLMTTTYRGLSAEAALSRFLFTHGNATTTLIDSGRVDTQDGTYLRATILDGLHKKAFQFDKQYLVPQGEFVPYLYAAVLRLFGLGSVVDLLAKDSSYRPGPLAQTTTTDIPSYLPGILFCFESVRPDGARSLVQSTKMPFIVHPLSHSWFHTPVTLWHQLDTMLMVQSRWSGVPILTAGNQVSGKMYLPNGTTEPGEIIESGNSWELRKFSF